MDHLLDLPLLELLDMEVTSVSRREQNLLTAPAAIHVVTNDDLRRRGITSVADALRMVPGIHVASIDGNKWVVSSRGHGGRFSNKLLVQIDGRSVYTPAFSGVYWDIQDLVIADIDRIEVIRGPGAALWGANAVNGVVSITTKSAEATQGWLLEAGTGNQLSGLATLRYGMEIDDNQKARFYLKSRQYESNDRVANAGDANDDWDVSSAGFRLDGAAGDDSWTLQGDLFQANEDQLLSAVFQPAPVFAQAEVKDKVDSTAWNILGRWERNHNSDSTSTLQLYWDHTKRNEVYAGQKHDTLDVDFQNQLSLGENHSLVWGLGYRRVEARYRNSFSIKVIPESQNTDLYSAFFQDQITLLPSVLTLTLGSKFEHNEFTGFEVQPSARVMWLPAAGHSVWASISRAVRTPSIGDNGSDVVSSPVPAFMVVRGNEDFQSETVDAYEIGYRYHGSNQFTIDATAFYNEYDDYRSFEFSSPTVLLMDNQIYGNSSGLELSGVWQAARWWQLKASYSYLHLDMKNRQQSTDTINALVLNGSYAKNMWKLQSSMDVADAWEIDAWFYYVGSIDAPSTVALMAGTSIDDYVSTNARVAWKYHPDVELSVTANNIFDSGHLEYVGEHFSVPTEISRSVLAQIRWQF
ncbi:MAG: TonB-dependent receptor [Motiliproteus sp.]